MQVDNGVSTGVTEYRKEYSYITFVKHKYKEHATLEINQELPTKYVDSERLISITQVLDGYKADHLHKEGNPVTRYAMQKNLPTIEYPNLVLDRFLEQLSKRLP